MKGDAGSGNEDLHYLSISVKNCHPNFRHYLSVSLKDLSSTLLGMLFVRLSKGFSGVLSFS